MENYPYIKFDEPYIEKQESGVEVELLGGYIKGSRVVLRGYIKFGEDKLDYIMGQDNPAWEAPNV